MKKFLSLICLFFILTAAAPVEITRAGRSDLNAFQRSGYVFGRGVLNALASPMELVRTFKIEKRDHTRLWPITMIPKSFYNFFMRISSAGYDIAIYPFFVVPFTDDIRPMSRYFEMPDYPWQLEVGEE